MSFTETIEKRKYSTIILSPSKSTCNTSEAIQSHPESINRDDGGPSVSQTDNNLYKWTFSKSAIASCFIKDILEMRENENLST